MLHHSITTSGCDTGVGIGAKKRFMAILSLCHEEFCLHVLFSNLTNWLNNLRNKSGTRNFEEDGSRSKVLQIDLDWFLLRPLFVCCVQIWTKSIRALLHLTWDLFASLHFLFAFVCLINFCRHWTWFLFVKCRTFLRTDWSKAFWQNAPSHQTTATVILVELLKLDKLCPAVRCANTCRMTLNVSDRVVD